MGDVLLMEPMIRNLKYTHPHALIIVYTRYTELFLHNPYIDILIKEERYGSFNETLTIQNCTDVLINLDFAYEKQPEFSIMQAYKKEAGVHSCIVECKPILYFQPLYHKKLQPITKELININPEKIGAINIGRKYEHDRTIPLQIIEKALIALQKEGVEIVFLLGTNDNYNAQSLPTQQNYPQIIDLVGKTSLHESALILSFCDIFIAPDTGLVHLAAAVSCPTIAFFGLALPEKRIDYSSNIFGLIREDLECIGCLHKTKNNIDPHCKYEYENYPHCLDMEEQLLRSIKNFFSLPHFSKKWKEKVQLLFNV